MTATPLPISPSPPAGKWAEDRPLQASNDSFASLTGLMKSKKPWTLAPTPLVPASDSQSHIRPPTRDEKPFEKPKSVRSYEAVRPTAKNAAEPLLASSRASYEKATSEAWVSPKPPALTPSTSQDQGYNEQAMRQMEDMITEMRNMETEGKSEWEVSPSQATSHQLHQHAGCLLQALIKDNTTESASSKGYVDDSLSRTSAFGFKTTGNESDFLSVDSQPIVRCTQQVWDTMIKQMSIIKKEKMEALAKLASLECDEHQRLQTEGDDASELDQLRFRLKTNKDHKAAMSQDIRKKAAELYNKDLEIDHLKKQVGETAAIQKELEKLHTEVSYLRTESVKATEVAKENEANAESFSQLIEFKDQEIARLKDEVTRSDAKLASHQTRAENLVDTQAVREKKLKQTEQQLRAVQDANEKFLDDLELLKTEMRPMEGQIKNLESQLREKSSDCDRMRNNLKHTEKRYEVASTALRKVENHKQLKGAAHLIIPNEKTKLPKLVLPCLECFAKNLPCDSNSRCQNCAIHGEKCARWRCSQVHILQGGCQDFPCLLTHDGNGWLMLKHEQPQW